MNQIHSLLDPNCIYLNLDVSTKEDCIQQLAEGLEKQDFIEDVKQYVRSVMDRETIGSTGVGFEVAIPHGKSAGVKKAGLAFAKLAQPVEWDSIDGQPVKMVFQIAVPASQAGNEHLKILSALSRKIIHESFRDQLRETNSEAEVIRLLSDIL